MSEYRIREAADLLGVSDDTLRRWIDAGPVTEIPEGRARIVCAGERIAVFRYGGKISSEWTFPKALQMLEEDAEIFHAAERIIEGADWVVWQLCGVETRNTCTAGYKEIYQDGAYPSTETWGK